VGQGRRLKKLVNQLGKKIPHSAGDGNENVADTQKNEDYFNGENNAGKKKKIGKKKDNAAANAFVSLVEE